MIRKGVERVADVFLLFVGQSRAWIQKGMKEDAEKQKAGKM